MAVRQYYIVNKHSGAVVNGVLSGRTPAEILRTYPGTRDLEVKTEDELTAGQREGYRYWSERP